MAKVYTKKEEALFTEEVAFHRIQQLDKLQVKHVAGILNLKDAGTQLDLLKVILGYPSSITVSTQERIDIFQAVNDFLDITFLAKIIHKEQKPETNFATKREASSIVKPNLTDTVRLHKFKINRKIGKGRTEFYELIYKIQNELTFFFFFLKVTSVML